MQRIILVRESSALFTLTGLQSNTALWHEEIGLIAKYLESIGYQPILRRACTAILQAADLPRGHEAELLADIIGGFQRQYDPVQTSELLSNDSSLMILQPHAGTLMLWEIRQHHDPSCLNDLAQNIASAAPGLLEKSRTGSIGIDWRKMAAYVPNGWAVQVTMRTVDSGLQGHDTTESFRAKQVSLLVKMSANSCYASLRAATLGISMLLQRHR